MSKKLNWVDVLNNQVCWQSREDVRVWFNRLVGRNTTLLDSSIEAFEEILCIFRLELSKNCFHEPVDVAWLDTQLKTVNLGLVHQQGARAGDESGLPLFRARVKGLHDSDLLRAVKDTLIVQFAEFISNSIDSEGGSVRRCEGLYRDADSPQEFGELIKIAHHIFGKVLLPKVTEDRWLAELALPEPYSEIKSLRRCSILIADAARVRFCSESCKFSTLQLQKQVQTAQPAAAKTKTRRYTRRQAEPLEKKLEKRQV